MIAWELIVSPRAEKQLLALPQRDRHAIVGALERLRADFPSGDLKKLTGRHDEWCLRVGRWRVILRLDYRDKLIHVERVLPRGRAYRG